MNDPALLPWMPVIVLGVVLLIGFVIRASMGVDAGAPPAPPAAQPHETHTH